MEKECFEAENLVHGGVRMGLYSSSLFTARSCLVGQGTRRNRWETENEKWDCSSVRFRPVQNSHNKVQGFFQDN